MNFVILSHQFHKLYQPVHFELLVDIQSPCMLMKSSFKMHQSRVDINIKGSEIVDHRLTWQALNYKQ